MTSRDIDINAIILEFKDWLELHRSETTAYFRKTNAIKYYFFTMSIGITIFLTSNMINDGELNKLKIMIIIFLALLTFLSHRITHLLSGAKGLMKIPAVELEVELKWFKNISDVMEAGNMLLDNFYVKKAVKLSKRNRFELFFFLKSMVVIADSVMIEDDI